MEKIIDIPFYHVKILLVIVGERKFRERKEVCSDDTVLLQLILVKLTSKASSSEREKVHVGTAYEACNERDCVWT